MKILVIDGQGGWLGRKLLENIRKICLEAEIIMGLFGIVTADAMMGEISPAMANAVASSPGYRVLIPMNLCSTYIAGVTAGSAAILEDAMQHIRQLAGEERKP